MGHFFDMHMPHFFRQQFRTDRQQQQERASLQRRFPGDHTGENGGGEAHHENANRHAEHHNPELIRQRHRCDHIIDAERQIGEFNRQHRRPESAAHPWSLFVSGFSAVGVIQFGKMVKCKVHQIRSADDAQPGHVNNDARQRQHQPATDVCAEQPDFERRLALIPKSDLRPFFQKSQRLGPWERAIIRQMGDHRTKHGGIVD